MLYQWDRECHACRLPAGINPAPVHAVHPSAAAAPTAACRQAAQLLLGLTQASLQQSNGSHAAARVTPEEVSRAKALVKQAVVLLQPPAMPSAFQSLQPPTP